MVPGREDRLKWTQTSGRHGILHIVKVSPLPNSDLTGDKIQRGVQDFNLTLPGSSGSCFN
jgi:hypothetical protein